MLYSEGDYADEVYFIVKGVLHFVEKEYMLPYTSYINGTYFGEVEYVKNLLKRIDNSEVASHIELLSISTKVRCK